MPRETALEKARRELAQSREDQASAYEWALELAAETRRLGDRCTFLYKQAMKFATDLAAEKLKGSG